MDWMPCKHDIAFYLNDTEILVHPGSVKTEPGKGDYAGKTDRRISMFKTNEYLVKLTKS